MEPESAKNALVWVVDDSPLFLDAVRDALAPSFDVELFGDGAELLEKLIAATSKPDILIVDWHMDGLQGIEVCRFVRATFDATALPIVILTATSDHEDLLAGFEAGANDYVGKPFKVAELNARVRGLVRTKRLGDQLRDESAFRERFMSILGHDLRQPLNTFALGSHALSADNLSPAQRQSTVKRLTNAVERMNRMINDLLDVSRARLGNGIPVEIGLVKLDDLCKRVVEDARIAHPERAIAMKSSGELVGHWDYERLTQVCANLVGNAIEHGAVNSPITVVLEGSADDVVLRVENSGTPISDSLLPGIFEPFRRGSEAPSKGLGLGLFIVNQVARAHGGTASAESVAGVTRIEVRIPKNRAVAGRPPDSWH